MNQGVRTEIYRILLLFFLYNGDDSRIPGKRHDGQGVHVVEFPGKPVHIPGGIGKLHIAVHYYIGSIPVEIQRITPCLLSIGHQMHIPAEKELLAAPVIPAVLGRKHVFIFPGIGAGAECSHGQVRLVFEGIGLDENGVGEHIDIRLEIESLDFRIIRSCLALDYLSVLIPHGPSPEKDGHTVFRVVIQKPRPQSVVVLVLELDHISTELRQIRVYVIFHLLALQLCLILYDTDVPDSIYDPCVDIPQGSIAEKIGIVVQKPRRAYYLPVIHTVYLQELCTLSA